MNAKPARLCAHCNAPTKHQRPYCSIACAGLVRRRPARLCLVCQKPLTYNQDNYCSYEHGYTRFPGRLLPKPPCRHCGKPLPDRQIAYCSNVCRNADVPPRDWDATLIAMWLPDYSLLGIARKCGVSLRVVERRAMRLGLPAKPMFRQGPAKSSSDEQDALLRAIYPSGTSFDDIQARVNALPGRKLETRKQLQVWVNRLKIRRSKAVQRAAVSATVKAMWAARRAAAPPPELRRDLRKPLPQREVYRLAAELREQGVRMPRVIDVAWLSVAWRKANPGHPGFRQMSKWQ